jgi:superfamily II DNA or RNA helicase
MDTKVLTPWDKLQERALTRIDTALKTTQRIVAVAPTGFGKSTIMRRIMQDYPGRHCLVTHRRLLFQQLHAGLLKLGIRHGCRAAGYRDYYFPKEPIQLCMAQTEQKQVEELKRREFHNADYVHIDEAHCQKDDFTKRMLAWHVANGAKIIGYTATPVGLEGMYDSLVELARTSEVRLVKGIVPARCYAPSTVDLRDVKKVSVDGEYSQKALGQKFKVQQVVGSVYEWMLKLNPAADPTLLFAPGVEEAQWYCEELCRRGIPSASVDAKFIYYGKRDAEGNRVLLPSTPGERANVEQGLKDGSLRCITNRFVYREGIDIPILKHLVLATAFATEEGYLQAVGRVLRSAHGKTEAVIQDHGGNVYRHGNPNLDRVWNLSDTNSSRAKERKAAEQDEEMVQLTCPQCRRVIPPMAWSAAGKKCPICGYAQKMAVKFVLETNGKLTPVSASVKKKPSNLATATKLIDSLFYGARNSKKQRGLTFSQVRGLFNGQLGHQYQLMPDPKTRVTVVRDRTTGEQAMVRNLPHWDSGYWNFEVRQTPQEQLQGVRYGKAARDRPERQDGGGIPDGALFQAEEA